MDEALFTSVLSGTGLVLLLALVLGLLRIWLGPEMADRMLSAQLFSSGGIALLLVLAELARQPALRDAALLLALLAVMSTVAFIARVWRPDRRMPGASSREPGERE